MRIEAGVAGGLLRRLLVLLCLLAAGAAPAQTIESVLSPGPVIEGHAKTEHDCKACHLRFDRNAQDGLCTACHKEVGQDVRGRTGWHGRQDQAQPCRACHTDHKGRAEKVAAFDTRTFDHGKTDYALRDKHSGVECKQCHLPAKRWREATATCVGCHKKDDEQKGHKGGLGSQCEDCHTPKDWKTTVFDHGKTRFALSGKHVDTKCDGCHATHRYKDTPRTCIGCHRKDDGDKGHKGQYGEKCESCHNAKAWKPSTFNHDTATRYALKDKHREVKCAACHTTMPLYGHKTGTACIDCHKKDDKHKETLGTKCGDCHTEKGWKEPPHFDHAKSRFPLLGAHVKTACKDCHKDQLFRQTPGECVDCHKKDDKHQGNLGVRCADCHGEVNWKPLPGKFDHSKTRFPLRNAHGARSVKCQDCHESQRNYRGLATTCISCHKRDDRHEGTLGERCESCHTDVNWRVARFDHAATRYPLAGRHLVVACKSCHQSLRYREAPRDCTGCHRKDDTHKATLGVQCESCHNVRAWALWDFDHDRGTNYRLEGKHRKLRCDACHSQPAPVGRKAAPVGRDCMACHRKDDVHEGRFGRRCEQCHGNDDWKRLKQATAPR
jgi:hypothetical protein